MKKIALLLFSATLIGSSNAQNDTYKAYSNYDFQPGKNIIFEDDFSSDIDGEPPQKWKITGGQVIINKKEDRNYANILNFYTTLTPNIKIDPKAKVKTYITDTFTIEFDFYLDERYDSNNGPYIAFQNSGKELKSGVYTSRSHISINNNGENREIALPSELAENFLNKWHHLAIAYQKGLMKVYMDQFRIAVISDMTIPTAGLVLGGDASEGLPMLCSNFRYAQGGNMISLGKKFTDTKIIAYGIQFDYNKASIKPESMGTINAIKKLLDENPDLKFEVGGHTDSDGEDAYNLDLSQKRANAVRDLLIKLGVNAGRLSSKGYGETKPLNPNITADDKAKNRRVEFVKQN